MTKNAEGKSCGSAFRKVFVLRGPLFQRGDLNHDRPWRSCSADPRSEVDHFSAVLGRCSNLRPLRADLTTTRRAREEDVGSLKFWYLHVLGYIDIPYSNLQYTRVLVVVMATYLPLGLSFFRFSGATLAELVALIYGERQRGIKQRRGALLKCFQAIAPRADAKKGVFQCEGRLLTSKSGVFWAVCITRPRIETLAWHVRVVRA